MLFIYMVNANVNDWQDWESAFIKKNEKEKRQTRSSVILQIFLWFQHLWVSSGFCNECLSKKKRKEKKVNKKTGYDVYYGWWSSLQQKMLVPSINIGTRGTSYNIENRKCWPFSVEQIIYFVICMLCSFLTLKQGP